MAGGVVHSWKCELGVSTPPPIPRGNRRRCAVVLSMEKLRGRSLPLPRLCRYGPAFTQVRVRATLSGARSPIAVFCQPAELHRRPDTLNGVLLSLRVCSGNAHCTRFDAATIGAINRSRGFRGQWQVPAMLSRQRLRGSVSEDSETKAENKTAVKIARDGGVETDPAKATNCTAVPRGARGKDGSYSPLKTSPSLADHVIHVLLRSACEQMRWINAASIVACVADIRLLFWHFAVLLNIRNAMCFLPSEIPIAQRVNTASPNPTRVRFEHLGPERSVPTTAAFNDDCHEILS